MKVTASISITLCTTLFLTACSTASHKISEVYVSPLQYNSYDCAQLAAEEQRIQVRLSQVGGRLDESAKNDKLIAAISLPLYGIPLFFVGGTKEQEAEFARLKGELNALQQAAIQTKCMNAIKPKLDDAKK